MVGAFLGAAGLQIVGVERDTWGFPAAWKLPGGLYLVDRTHTAPEKPPCYCVSRTSSGFQSISKDAPLAVAVEIAATFSLPPGQRSKP